MESYAGKDYFRIPKIVDGVLHNYIFSFPEGLTEKVDEAMMDCAEDDNHPIEWKDILPVINLSQHIRYDYSVTIKE